MIGNKRKNYKKEQHKIAKLQQYDSSLFIAKVFF